MTEGTVIVNTDVTCLTIRELAPLLRSGQIDPVGLVEMVLARVEISNPTIRAYVTVTEPDAIAQAQLAKAEMEDGVSRGPLHGIPIALKDVFHTRGIRTTAASKILRDFVPRDDAASVRALRASGAVVLGKLNLHEFAYGPTSLSSYYGPVGNPWSVDHIAGGSSGGSAAAVVASLCIAATGSDTGGSIRIPASICGVVGFKPTYGRISMEGVIPLARSLDHIGPLARSVYDATVMFKAMLGGKESQPPLNESQLLRNLEGGVRGLRLGLPEGHFVNGVDPSIREVVERAVEVLADLGADVQPVRTTGAEQIEAAYRPILMSEATAVHERWMKTEAHSYSPDVLARLKRGRQYLALDYLRARDLQNDVIQRFESLLTDHVDVLVLPTVSIPTPTIKNAIAHPDEITPGLVVNTSPFNVTGEPVISVPCGYLSNGLPVGLSIVARRGSDDLALRVAYAYEQATDWHLRRAPVLDKSPHPPTERESSQPHRTSAVARHLRHSSLDKEES